MSSDRPLTPFQMRVLLWLTKNGEATIPSIIRGVEGNGAGGDDSYTRVRNTVELLVVRGKLVRRELAINRKRDIPGVAGAGGAARYIYNLEPRLRLQVTTNLIEQAAGGTGGTGGVPKLLE